MCSFQQWWVVIWWVACAVQRGKWKRLWPYNSTKPFQSPDSYTTVRSFFYVHNICECDKHNILNLILVHLHLKHTVSATQQSIRDFFGQTGFQTDIKVIFLFVYYFSGLSATCKIFIFCHCFLRFLTQCFPANSILLLEKLTSSQLVKKLPAFHATRRFFTAFTSARHLSLY
jgi:hypothetical protein